jgi:hypothetical protein
MSANLCDVCSTACCLPTFIAFSYLHEVCLTKWLIKMKSSLLHDVCLPVWFMLYCMMSFYLYDVCSTVWYLSTCMILRVLCLLNCMMSAYLYGVSYQNDVCQPVWCLPSVWSLLNCKMSAHLPDVCSTLYLPTCVISSHLYDVFLPV